MESSWHVIVFTYYNICLGIGNDQFLRIGGKGVTNAQGLGNDFVLGGSDTI